MSTGGADGGTGGGVDGGTDGGVDGGWAGRFVPRGVLPPASIAPSFGARLAPFMDWQAGCWPRLATARAGLEAVRTRELSVDGRRVLAQFNPGRAVSTTAKVDAASIQQRPCFLCPANLPDEEKGLAYGRHWVLLANPAPILPQHFVLAHRDHRPQRARDAIPILVAFAADTGGYASCIYNGPACGASAPDHLHLQSVQAGLLPEELAAWAVVDGAPAEGIVSGRRLRAWVVPGPGPVLLGFFGSPTVVQRALNAAADALAMLQGEPDEPRLNLVASGRDGQVLALLFPRAAHRPACYHAPEPQRRLISPGAIDMAGLLVTVREADFESIDVPLVRDIYRETSLGMEHMARVRDLLVRRLAHV